MNQPDPGPLPDSMPGLLEPGALRWQTADALRDRTHAIVTDAMVALPSNTRIDVDAVPVGVALVGLAERFLVELDARVERAKGSGDGRVEALEIHPALD